MRILRVLASLTMIFEAAPLADSYALWNLKPTEHLLFNYM